MFIAYFSSFLGANSSMVVWTSTLFVLRLRSFSSNALSFFLEEVVLRAGAVWGDEGPPLSPHSICGFFTSAVSLASWSVSGILVAAAWKWNSVFISFTFVIFSLFLVDCGPLVLSSLWYHR